MKNIIVFVSFFTFVTVCSQTTIKETTSFQESQNKKFADPKTSPLTKKDIRNFNGLAFFPISKKYKVKATFEKDFEEEFVGFKTTTSRVAPYKKYGKLHFTIDGKKLQLTVYKSTDYWGDPKKYKHHLFLPFKDKTNGKTSYGSGRYMDLSILDITNDNFIVVDFNNSYNPYCAYSNRFSCPKVPKENILDVAINAGVKKYKK